MQDLNLFNNGYSFMKSYTKHLLESMNYDKAFTAFVWVNLLSSILWPLNDMECFFFLSNISLLRYYVYILVTNLSSVTTSHKNSDTSK